MTAHGRWKAWLANLGITLLSLGFALVMAELAVRIIPVTQLAGEAVTGRKYRRIIGPTHQQLFVEYDPVLGWRKIPNSDAWFESTEWRIREHINSQGLRGLEIPFTRAEGRRRVLLLGDSFVEGYTQELPETVGAILEQELNRVDPRYEVVNGGAGGYSTDQEVLFFETVGVKYRPDVTVLMFYYNDVWYNNQPRYYRGAKPHFIRSDAGLVLTNVPVPPPGSVMSEGAPSPLADPPRRAGVKAWIGDRSALYKVVRGAVRNNHTLRTLAARSGFIATADIETPAPWHVWQNQYSPPIVAAWDVTARLLLRLKQAVEAAGGQLLVFYIPEKESVYPARWRATRRRYGMSTREWDVTRDERELLRICQTHRIECVDPTARFRTEAKTKRSEGERLYWDIDVHWNAHGHRFAAQILADHIRALEAGDPSRRSPS